MEKILETILEEIKGVKEEVGEIKVEVRETKQGLRSEMQEMKQGLRKEMDERFSQQSKEIAEELNNIVIYMERRDNELKETINGAIKVQNNILKELEKNKAEHQIFDARLYKLEIA